jgi:hypothetical protein
MTPAMQDYLTGMTDKQRANLARDSRKALTEAWPNRHSSFRAPIVIRANVTMLRNLASL